MTQAQVTQSRAQVAQRKAAAERAKANLEKARSDYERVTSLYGKDIKAVSKADVDAATAAVHSEQLADRAGTPANWPRSELDVTPAQTDLAVNQAAGFSVQPARAEMEDALGTLLCGPASNFRLPPRPRSAHPQRRSGSARPRRRGRPTQP